MRLDRIKIEDFGVFKDEEMEGLDGGITLIAGPQRAGKTTFMKVLRHLPYGLTGGEEIPPALDRHKVKAWTSENGEEVEIELDGQKDIKVSSKEGDVEIGDLRGNVTKSQYRQIFTISLDQIQNKLPDGVEDEKEFSELLLGAAFGKISEIPDIKEEFKDKAHSIGLSKGNPGAKTTELNDPYSDLEDAIDDKKEALNQVEEFKEKKKEFEDVKEDIEEAEEEIEDLEDDIARLGVLQEVYEQITELQRIQNRWSEEDFEEAESFPTDKIEKMKTLVDELEDLSGTTEAKEEFQRVTESENPETYREKILSKDSEIKSLRNKVSGWKSQADHIEEQEKKVEETREGLEARIKDLGPEYQGDFTEVDDIETDTVSENKVSKAVEDYKEALSHKEDKERELEQTRSQLESLEKELDGFDEPESEIDRGDVLKNLAAVSAPPLIVFAAAAFMNFTLAGLVVSIILLAVLSFMRSDKLVPDVSVNDQHSELKTKKTGLKTEIEGLETQVQDAGKEVEDARKKLREVMDDVGLQVNKPDTFKDQYGEVAEIKGGIRELGQREDDLEEKKVELKEELEEACSDLSELENIEITGDLEQDVEQLGTSLKELEKHVEAAREVQEEVEEKKAKKKSISDLITRTEEISDVDPEEADDEILKKGREFVEKGEELEKAAEDGETAEKIRNRLESRFKRSRNRELFQEYREDGESWIKVLKKRSGLFSGEDEIEQEIQNKEKKKEDVEEQKPEESRKAEIDQEMEDLASDRDINEAQEKIQRNQRKLQKLGEEYAVSRFAEKMADRLNQRFMDEVAGGLIQEAGEIFSEVTEEYDGIDHNEKIEDLQFKALREEGSQEVEELSRATAEQLFMSLRMARIKRIDADLPIVIDDSMTNFDPEHTARMLEIVEKVSEDNQVFILTCHPELIQIAQKKTDITQYYQLQQGKLSQRDSPQQLINELEVE